MQAITIYHNPKAAITHIITSEVNEDSGEHRVVDSVIHSGGTSHAWEIIARSYEKNVGAGNVRLYMVEEVRL